MSDINQVIYKYAMSNGVTRAPAGPVRLVAQQDGSELPTLWIEHLVNAPSDTNYYVRGTGQQFNDEGSKHVGSAVCGHFVWHVYAAPVGDQ